MTTSNVPLISCLQQDAQITELNRVVKKGFKNQDGPFVKALDTALKSFKVERQAYYGGTFVGNHVHKCLKVCDNLQLEVSFIIMLLIIVL